QAFSGPSTCSVVRQQPSAMLHTFTVPSSQTDKTKLPSRLIAQPRTSPACRANVRRSVPVSKSHNFSIPSLSAQTTKQPVGSTKQRRTVLVLSTSLRRSFPVVASQILIV